MKAFLRQRRAGHCLHAAGQVAATVSELVQKAGDASCGGGGRNAGTCRRLQMAMKVARGYKAAFDSSFAFFLAYADSSRVAFKTYKNDPDDNIILPFGKTLVI